MEQTAIKLNLISKKEFAFELFSCFWSIFISYLPFLTMFNYFGVIYLFGGYHNEILFYFQQAVTFWAIYLFCSCILVFEIFSFYTYLSQKSLIILEQTAIKLNFTFKKKSDFELFCCFLVVFLIYKYLNSISKFPNEVLLFWSRIQLNFILFPIGGYFLSYSFGF